MGLHALRPLELRIMIKAVVMFGKEIARNSEWLILPHSIPGLFGALHEFLEVCKVTPWSGLVLLIILGELASGDYETRGGSRKL